jgi:hypothetical protein
VRETPHIFVDYARADGERAGEILERLSAEGFKTLTDGGERAGEGGWALGDPTAFLDADFFLICLSNNAVDAKGVLLPGLKRKLDYLWRGANGQAFLIPVRLEECRVPKSLQAFECVDLFTLGGWAELLAAIEETAARRRQLDETYADGSPRGVGEAKAALETGAATRDVSAELEGPADPTSIFDWGVDLRKLIAGKRDAAVERLGGIEEYVEVILASVSEAEAEAAEEAFNQALDKLVQTWQPTAPGREDEAARMLELIKTYSPPPPASYNKIMELVRWVKVFENGESEEGEDDAEDLRLLGLVALENYFGSPPLPPVDDSDAYRAYLSLLEEDLDNRARGWYALRRLKELHGDELTAAKVKALIGKNPAALNVIINHLLDPNWRSKAEQELTLVYVQCLEAGEEAELGFERAVVSCGGEFVRRPDPGPLVKSRGQTIELDLSGDRDVLFKYYEMRLIQETKAGRKIYDSMSTTV